MPAATSIEADLVTHNKSIGAPLHCNQLYGYGLRCGVSIADHPSPLSCSERTSPHSKISKTKGFVGGVPVNTETSASEILRVRRFSKRGSGVRSFLSYVAQGSNQGSAPLTTEKNEHRCHPAFAGSHQQDISRRMFRCLTGTPPTKPLVFENLEWGLVRSEQTRARGGERLTHRAGGRNRIVGYSATGLSCCE